MAELPPMMRLSNELLREILDHIEEDPEKLVNLDRRAYLSQESFKPPPRPSRDQARDVSHFRLACRTFSELGAIHQFARVATRFSQKGLKRLENIASQPHLARNVKKFSYMVPYFYVEGRERVRDLSESLGHLDVKSFNRKVKEQKEIVHTEEDVRVLRKAASAFTSLQHVQILRVQDKEDEQLLQFLRHHNELTRLVELKWAPACSHSTRTLGAALIASQSPCSRFSSPMLSPQSAKALTTGLPSPLQSFASRLTSLELHFDDGTDLDNKMTELSGLFCNVFFAAYNLQAVHVGFPSYRPLSLSLEDVFHHVKWDKLSAFGIQAWRLDAEEILGFVNRHRERLRGLRLRDVLLKEPSRWKDVLSFLRNDVPQLDWVSLRRIGYAKHFDEQWGAAGVEVPDDLPGGASESDEESDNDSNAGHQSDGIPNPSVNSDINTDDNSSATEISDEESEDDDEHGSEAHEVNLPIMSTQRNPPVPWCTCDSTEALPNTAEDLGDDGVSVSNTQRKIWEQWVRHRCSQHVKNK